MSSKKMNIGAVISLDGEKEYRQAISDINKAQAVLRSEMKLASAQFEENANSTEALQKKQGILEDQYDSQAKRVATLRGALQDAAEQYGENSKKVQDWKIKLNNAESDLIKLDREISDNQEQMRNAALSADDTAEAIEDYTAEVEDAGEETSVFGEVLKANLASEAIIGAVKTLAGGIKTLGSNVYDFSVQGKQALNNFAAQTGTAKDELGQFEDVMRDIYTNNFGEDMGDIANTMAVIKQNLSQMNPAQLKEASENALLLRDTFGYDTQEQIRAVKMLMQQFGLTADESYNLITQGAQNGLDKNGDLLDTINEYSVHFKSMGYDAEDMFNMLVNGANSGTFSVDKLGDAVKEFGIRLHDATADDALSQMGLDAAQIRKEFDAGGDSATAAGRKVVTALKDMSNKTDQYNAGVAMFGTMFEDMGIDAIDALMSVDGQIDLTTDALGQLNDIRYDDLQSNLDLLGRKTLARFSERFTGAMDGASSSVAGLAESVDHGQLGDSIDNLADGMAGLAEGAIEFATAALPPVVDGLTWILDNGQLIAGTTLAAAAAWVTYKVAAEGAAVKTALLNAALNVNPVALLIGGIAALTLGIGSWIGEMQDAAYEADTMQQKLDELSDRTENLKGSVDRSSKSYDDSKKNIQEEYGAAKILSDELYKLADKHNKTTGEIALMKGMVDELNGIMPDLNLSIDEQNGLLSMNKEQMDAVIESQMNLAMAEAAQERLKDIAKERVEAELNLAEATKARDDAQKELDANAEAAAAAEEKRRSGVALTAEEMKACEDAIYNNHFAYDDLQGKIEEADEIIKQNQEVLDESQNKFDELSGVIKGFSEDTTEAKTKTEEMQTAIVEFGGQTYVVSQETAANFDTIKQKYDEVYQAAKNSIESQLGLFDEFDQKQAYSKEEMLKNLQSQINGMTTWSDDIQTLSDKGINEGLLRHLQEMGPESYQYTHTLVTMTDEELENLNALYDSKLQISDTVAKKMTDANSEMVSAVEELKKSADAVSGSMNSYGNNAASSFANSFIKKMNDNQGSMMGPFNTLKANAKNTLMIHSPSRFFDDLGVDTGEGYENGALRSLTHANMKVKEKFEELKKIDATIPASSALNIDVRNMDTVYTTASGQQGILGQIYSVLVDLSRKDTGIYLDSAALVGRMGRSINDEMGEMAEMSRRYAV